MLRSMEEKWMRGEPMLSEEFANGNNSYNQFIKTSDARSVYHSDHRSVIVWLYR